MSEIAYPRHTRNGKKDNKSSKAREKKAPEPKKTASKAPAEKRTPQAGKQAGNNRSGRPANSAQRTQAPNGQRPPAGSQQKKRGKGGKGALAALLVIVVLLAAAFVGIGAVAQKSEKVLPGVTCMGIDVSKLNEDELSALYQAARYCQAMTEADIDTLRELVSQSLPSLLQSSVIVLTVLCIMLWYSVWMTLVVLFGVAAMIFVSSRAGGGSAKYFIRQQKSVAKTEGYVQEMMNG